MDIGLEKSVGEIEFSKWKEGFDLLEKFINIEKNVEKDIFNFVYNLAGQSMCIIKTMFLKEKF